MRKSTLAAASVAILGAVALAGCDMLNMGGDEKEDAAATEEGGEAAAGAGLGGKPADEGAGGASEGGEEAGGSGEAAGGGAKPDEGGGDAGGSSGGQQGGGEPTEQDVINHYSQQLDGYLDGYVQQYGPNLRPTNIRDVVVPLQAGSEHRWSVNLEGGTNYGVFGACDNDCSDVDLIVEGPNGQELGRDVLLDDYPIVGFTAPSSGRYTVRIVLATCEVEPCFVAGRILQQ